MTSKVPAWPKLYRVWGYLWRSFWALSARDECGV
jgi:hypothetical protein